LRQAENTAADIQEEWIHQYGAVFSRPAALGKVDVVVTDTKALAHIFAAMEVVMKSSKGNISSDSVMIRRHTLQRLSVCALSANSFVHQRPSASHQMAHSHTQLGFDSILTAHGDVHKRYESILQL
jgi:hypothetical protein